MSGCHSHIRPPATVVEIARTLHDAGHETWCVGGAVRDALLGLGHLDWDLATAATPQQVRRLFRRTIPVGVEFGTVGVLDAAGTLHEVTTFRRDVQTDGRHAVVEFGASLDEDLARRDFTINAIAFHPITHELHDPFRGRADLESRLVRAVGVAAERMHEDRLRALRAIRFAARFDFDIEQSTWNAIVESAPHLSRLSPERVRQEIEKTMDQVKCPSNAFVRWRNAGAFGILVPALARVNDTTLSACDMLPPHGMRTRPDRRALRLAALFSELDFRAVERAMKALRFSNRDTAFVATLVGHWRDSRELLERMLADGAADDGDVRRMAARVGRLRVAPFGRVANAIWNACRSAGQRAPEKRAVRLFYRRLLHSAFHDPIELADLAIDGDDLRSAGIPGGKHVGKILARMLDDVLNDPANNQRQLLLDRAKQMWETTGKE